MVRHSLKSKKGMALVMIVLVVLVLMVLGAALLSVGLTETRSAVYHQHTVQARNIALSGANNAAKYIMENSTREISELPQQNEIIPLGEGSYTVSAAKNPGEDIVVITSVGEVQGVNSTVNLTLSGFKPSLYFDGIRQTKEGQLDLDLLYVTYPPEDPVTITANYDLNNDGNLDADAVTFYKDNEGDPNISLAHDSSLPPSINVPTDLTGYTNRLAINDAYTFNGNYKVLSITTQNREPLTFNTGNSGDNQYLIVDNLNVGDDFIVNGQGSLHIFIINSGSFNTPRDWVFDATNPATVFIYVMPGKTLSFISNYKAFAYIFAPEATVAIQSDQTTIEGAIIGQVLIRMVVPNPSGPHGNFVFNPLSADLLESALTQYNRAYYSN